MSSVVANVEYLKTSGLDLPADASDALHDLALSTTHLTRLADELTRLLSPNDKRVRPSAVQTIEVRTLTEQLRRRLRAFVHGKDIRSTTLSTTKAPASIRIDRTVLDRITDNILTNAAKYTDRGSIVLEVDGEPGHLVIKVSDTGRGIPEDRIERIFEADMTAPEDRSPTSFGVGLSVVVALLEEISGSLEVMSEVNVGTTFWIKIPVDAKARHPDAWIAPASPAVRESGDGRIGNSTRPALPRSVRIRKHPA